jgi:protein farnesyltransferase subunit beta
MSTADGDGGEAYREEATPTSREQDKVERSIVRILRRALLEPPQHGRRALPFEDYVSEQKQKHQRPSSAADQSTDASSDEDSDDFEDYDDDGVGLCRLQHAAYAGRGLRGLPGGYASLDASRPWLCYWVLNALDLLNALPSTPTSTSTSSSTRSTPAKRTTPSSSSPSASLASMTSRVVDFLKRCQAPSGGFGGGPGQLPHMAPTYAAVNALVIVGTEEAYRAIDRPGLHAFLLARKRPDGSFTMHEDGEVDIRGSCRVACACVSCRVVSCRVAC